MQFTKASDVESICWSLRYADHDRAINRERINSLFNGFPPYSPTEQKENDIQINVNSLEGTRIAHDARAQFYGAFMKPGTFFKCSTDWGPTHKRNDYGSIFTSEMNKIMKRSMIYFETFRSKFALNVLHGIGPAGWDNPDSWCPDGYGVEDLLIPSMTLLTMKNLPFFAIYRSYTAAQLIKMTRGPKVQKGWNLPLVNSCIEWIDSEASKLMGANWNDHWRPEHMQERVKGDGACYSTDQVPTINCYDFYYWDDANKTDGWRRRLIVDAWSSPSLAGEYRTTSDSSPSRRSELDFSKNQFLFDPGDRVYACKLSELVNFTFADLSAVAPFRYHSVRSLGFLIYAVCHLQNRLRCRFNESVFEALMMYFRVSSTDEAQRALKLNLFNKGIIDESLKFVPQSERHQVNTQLVELGLAQNSSLMREHASAYTQNPSQNQGSVEKTKFQFMSEMQLANSLVSAGLLQAYKYQQPEYYEIIRRFCRKNSKDPEVLSFQAAVLKRRLPEKYLDPACWEASSEQVMGNGNKTLEMAIAAQLMEYRNLYDPDAQRQILRDVTLAVTDDPSRAESLVPIKPNQVTESVHDAELSANTMLNGIIMGLRQGVNHQEYAGTLLKALMATVQKVQGRNNVATQEELAGMQILAGQTIQGQPVPGNGITSHLQILAQDKSSQQIVKQLGDVLGKAMNEVKAFAQRLQEMQQQAAAKQNGNGIDPETQSKVQANLILAKAKAANTRESHAERTAQRRIQFEQDQKQKAQKFQQEMQESAQEHGMGIGQAHQEHIQGLGQSHQEHTQNLHQSQQEGALDLAMSQLEAEQAAQQEPEEPQQ